MRRFTGHLVCGTKSASFGPILSSNRASSLLADRRLVPYLVPYGDPPAVAGPRRGPSRAAAPAWQDELESLVPGVVHVLQSCAMERIAVRELRNQASRVVRRARAGERMLITVDGVPVAEIGPVRATGRGTSLPELIATGAVTGPRSRTIGRAPRPVPAPSGRTSSSVLRDLRDR